MDLEKSTPTNSAVVLKNLFTRNDNIGKDFCHNIRAYNNVFAFTSIGIKLDKELANSKNSSTSGIYHSIGSLLPVNGVPRFLQLYIYNTKFETTNRQGVMPQLNQ
ncbi:2622_t:CDS:2, partial [Gigaspora rosea]